LPWIFDIEEDTREHSTLTQRINLIRRILYANGERPHTPHEFTFNHEEISRLSRLRRELEQGGTFVPNVNRVA